MLRSAALMKAMNVVRVLRLVRRVVRVHALHVRLRHGSVWLMLVLMLMHERR